MNGSISAKKKSQKLIFLVINVHTPIPRYYGLLRLHVNIPRRPSMSHD